MVQQEIPQFLGVNLREERMDLADEELAKAINADLHLSPGTIVLRLGRTKQNSSALSDLVVRRITKANSTNYRIAGAKIYRGDTLLTDPSAVDLSSNLITTFATFRPLGCDPPEFRVAFIIHLAHPAVARAESGIQ